MRILWAQLRAFLQERVEEHAEDEQYPPGPAGLAIADPETMPSEMEAMDALQRTIKVCPGLGSRTNLEVACQNVILVLPASTMR